MSHYHAEVVLPPTDDLAATIAQIMEPFREEDDHYNAFWDWFIIGGRFAGAKITQSVDQDKLDQFYKQLKAANVTVSSVQCGKQKLDPVSQVSVVDRMWSEAFPEHLGPCPLFQHSNDQYDNASTLPGDICEVHQISDQLKCGHLIVAGSDHDGSTRAQFMLNTSIWNGCNHQDTAWEGGVIEGLKLYEKQIAHRPDKWRRSHEVKPDWLCVTVDYHS